MHVLHATRLEGMEGVLFATELEQDDTERVDVCPHADVWELPNPCQEHLLGRIVVGGDAALYVGGAVHPEGIETQRRD